MVKILYYIKKLIFKEKKINGILGERMNTCGGGGLS